MRRATSLMCLAALLAIGHAYAADRIIFYRCTDAAGNVTLQTGKPCAKGQQQTKRVVEAPASSTPVYAPAAVTAPLPVAAPPATATLPAGPAQPAINTAERLPPPTLYRCHTGTRQSYLSDDGAPKARCVPLQVVGLDGNPQNGAGQACDMQQDECERITDDKLCDAWRERNKEAKSLVEFGDEAQRGASSVLLARSQRVLTETTCAP